MNFQDLDGGKMFTTSINVRVGCVVSMNPLIFEEVCNFEYFSLPIAINTYITGMFRADLSYPPQIVSIFQTIKRPNSKIKNDCQYFNKSKRGEILVRTTQHLDLNTDSDLPCQYGILRGS
uniref:Uncharacterized protein n=2 Tax=Cacopsylla melanoneura TaxID=428564 RepID=A0A8D8RRP6_9HEMI